MPMQKSTPAENPDAYVSLLGGWQKSRVEALRSTVVELVNAAVDLNALYGDPTSLRR